jgi:hypothetical protein
MQSKLKTTLLVGTVALLAALGGAQAQAGGFNHFNSYLLEGLHDDDYGTSLYGDDDEADPVTAAATAAAATTLLGGDEDDATASAAAAAAGALLGGDDE